MNSNSEKCKFGLLGVTIIVQMDCAGSLQMVSLHHR